MPKNTVLSNQTNRTAPTGHADRTAANVKDLRGRLGLTDDALRQIPIVEEGAALHQGSIYVDLNALDAGPFTAMGEQHAEQGQLLVPKHDVAYEIWNHLVGNEKPGQSFDGAPWYDTQR